jgi:hypothetical protein
MGKEGYLVMSVRAQTHRVLGRSHIVKVLDVTNSINITIKGDIQDGEAQCWYLNHIKYFIQDLI